MASNVIFKVGTEESGHHNHRGRPGRRGGSLPSGRPARILTVHENYMRIRRNIINNWSWRAYRDRIDEGYTEEDALAYRNHYRTDLTAALDEYLELRAINEQRTPVQDFDYLYTADMPIPGTNRDVVPIHDYMRDMMYDMYEAQDAELGRTTESLLDTMQGGNTGPGEDFADLGSPPVGVSVNLSTPSARVDDYPYTAGSGEYANALNQRITRTESSINNVGSAGDSARKDYIRLLKIASTNVSRAEYEDNINIYKSAHSIDDIDVQRLDNAYNFYHRSNMLSVESTTRVFGGPENVIQSRRALTEKIADEINDNSGQNPNETQDLRDSVNYVLAKADPNNLTALINNRSEYEDLVESLENTNQFMTPTTRMQVSAYWDHMRQIRTGDVNADVQAAIDTSVRPRDTLRRHPRTVEPATPPQTIVRMDTPQDFVTYVNSLRQSTANRGENIAISALRTIAIDPMSDETRLQQALTDFNALYPDRLSSTDTELFNKAFKIHHAVRSDVESQVMPLPEHYNDYVAKANSNKLISEIKASAAIKPLDIRSAAQIGSVVHGDIDDANTMLRAATGNPAIDAVDFINTTYNNFKAGGLTTKLTSINAGSDQISIDMQILNRHDTVVGSCERTIKRNGEVHNDLLSLDSSVRGEGFATAFYKHTEEQYIKAGMKKITIHANLSVGGYTWARMGFSSDSTSSFVNTLKYNYRQEYNTDLPFTPKSMWEVAAYRGPDGKKIGKELLLGTSWSAVKYLTDDDPGMPVGQAYYAEKLRERQ